ncbi:MAG: TlyA family RNA methyltransferase [Magnetococcales bacterium]|nr:TlyA family RNA methyltransferase [Magnetococcales bacterium]
MKKRLDLLLLENGLVSPLDKARAMIMAGQVLVDDRPQTKPGTLIGVGSLIRLKNHKKWVSRGSLKLIGALEKWAIDPTDLICLDVGASTGGFTDVLLQKGAKRVYALDVGYGILDWKLVSDPRVVVMDRTNIRHLMPEHIPEPMDFLCSDVSFISLKKALPAALATLKTGGQGVALIKPQFELPKQIIGPGGIVTESAHHQRAIDSILSQCETWNIHPIDTTPSPITGPKGNQEFLFYFSKLAKVS